MHVFYAIYGACMIFSLVVSSFFFSGYLLLVVEVCIGLVFVFSFCFDVVPALSHACLGMSAMASNEQIWFMSGK